MSRRAALRARASAFGYSLCCLKIFSDAHVLSRGLFRQIACEYRISGCTQKTWTQPTIFDSLNASGVSYKMYSNSSDVSPLRNPVLAVISWSILTACLCYQGHCAAEAGIEGVRHKEARFAQGEFYKDATAGTLPAFSFVSPPGAARLFTHARLHSRHV